jgi:hypothetical protein
MTGEPLPSRILKSTDAGSRAIPYTKAAVDFLNEHGIPLSPSQQVLLQKALENELAPRLERGFDGTPSIEALGEFLNSQYIELARGQQTELNEVWRTVMQEAVARRR